MFRMHTHWLAPAMLFAIASSTQAQSAQRDPLDARATVPPQTYESTFAHYRRLGDEQVKSWREVNDAVLRAGGWRFYAREAAEPGSTPTATSPSSAPPPKSDAEPEKPAPAGRSSHPLH